VADRIHQEVSFDAPPEEVFEELVDAERFAGFTGAPADVQRADGSAFSLFGGQIQGRNIELIPGQRVVQAWRVAGWDPGQYSIIQFELRADGNGTKLIFDQSGFPPSAIEELSSGWHAMYWEPMRAHLSGGR
jgi:activator of HSP90 ATPase